MGQAPMQQAPMSHGGGGGGGSGGGGGVASNPNKAVIYPEIPREKFEYVPRRVPDPKRPKLEILNTKVPRTESLVLNPNP